ncbi:hypothetical protein GmHk_14G040319 [Glycine max]|nr:hypothetical protein GmHk_14G040319 [Glycine max]
MILGVQPPDYATDGLVTVFTRMGQAHQRAQHHPSCTSATGAFQHKMMMMQSESLVAISFTFGASNVVSLEEAVCACAKASSLFRQRKKTNEEAPRRVLCYGNVFVLACAETTVKDLVVVDLHRGLEVVQEAKASLEDKGYIRSMIDLLEDKTTVIESFGYHMLVKDQHLGN